MLLSQLNLQSGGTTTLLLGAAVFLLGYVVLRPMMRRKADPLKTSPVVRGLAQQRSVERQMETLLVELSDMARQMTAQLDTRSAKLEILLREADETIARLKTHQQQASATTMRYEGLRYDAESAAQPARAPAMQPAPPPEPEPLPIAPPPAEDAHYEPIYAKADAGESVNDIARALGRPSGEIELILALRRKRA